VIFMRATISKSVYPLVQTLSMDDRHKSSQTEIGLHQEVFMSRCSPTDEKME
jgi:hypothetical protein